MTSREMLGYYLNKSYADAAAAKERGELICWSSSIAPNEFCEAMGIHVIYPENHAAAVAAKGGALDLLEVAEKKGYSIDLCSYARINLAYMDVQNCVAENIPLPDFVIVCNNICNTLLKWYENICTTLHIPMILIDVPFNYEDEISERSLDYIADQFVNAIRQMEEITGKKFDARKQIDVGKSVFTFGLGSKELYEFMNNNPSLRCMPVGYTNDPNVIAQNDRVYSICSCINVDLFGNISSESVGYKQISGTGGQLDYHFASLKSNGGKGFLCMHSSKVKRDGTRVSNIVPYFEPGTQISIPANMTNYIVTEYGIANMKGLTTWERVEELIRIAHPDFKQDIADAAEKAGLWKRSNKL